MENSSTYGELNRGVGVSFKGKKKKKVKKSKNRKVGYLTYG